MSAAIRCALCGITAKRSGGQALYCLPCATARRPRLAEPGRLRNCVVQPLRLNGGWACVTCRAPVEQSVYGGRKVRPPTRCTPCHRKQYDIVEKIRGRAAGALAAAIRLGHLQPARKYTCADCGRPAACYDHRDYTEPLKVDPVCRSCNVMRGPADFWPLVNAAPAQS